MPDPTAQQDTESEMERKAPALVPQPVPQAGRRSAVDHGGSVAPLMAMLASAGGQEPPPQQFAPIFFSPEYSDPANDAQRARLAGALQQQFGNRYVQRVLSGDEESESSARSIRRAEASGDSAAPAAPSLNGSTGHPLDTGTKDFMGSSFGQDFSGVRVHTDSPAQEAAQNLNSEAFTTGRDIYFSRGAYDPAAESGQKLLAHELAHVAQNERGVQASQDGVSRPDDPLERQARDAGEAVMRGEMFPPLSSGGAALQRQEAPAAPAAEGGEPAGNAPPGDFAVAFAGTTFNLPIQKLLRRAAPDSQLSVPETLLRKIPGPPGFKLTQASLNLDQNKAPAGGSLGVSLAIPPLSGSGTLDVDKKGKVTGSVDVTLSSKKIPGLTDTNVKANVGKDQFDLEMTVGFDLPKVTGSLTYRYKDQKHSGEGKAHYEGAKLKGDIEIKVSEAAKLSGRGTLDMEVFKGLVGKADVEVDEKRDIKVKGELRLAKQIELFPEKKYEKSFFNFEKKFPLWGITIPVIDVNVGLFAEIHASAGFRAKFGPGVIRDIALSGEFGTDPEAATQLGLTGEFFLPAGAEIVLAVGGGIGLGLAIADITGGVEAVGVAGIYTALSVRPTFEYAGGKYSIKGTAELAGVAQVKLGINAFAKIDVGVWLFKGTVWRKDWKLAEWIWNTGLNVALRANMSYTLGEDFVPDFTFEADKVDAEKLVRDVMPESGSPVPAPPKPAAPAKSTMSAGDATGEQKPGAGPEAAATPTPGSPPAKTEKGVAGAPETPGTTDAEKSKQVLSKVRADLEAKLATPPGTYEEVDAVISSVFRQYQPEGLKSLDVEGDKGRPGHFNVLAEASLPKPIADFLENVVGIPDIILKLDMFSSETHLFAQLPDGTTREYTNIPGADVHAEDLFLADLRGLVRQFGGGPDQPKPTIILMLNRTPCDRCGGNLARAAVQYKDKIQLVVRATVTYDQRWRQREKAQPPTTVKKLIEMHDAGITLEVWDIWDVIKANSDDPLLAGLDQATIDQNVDGKRSLVRQLTGVRHQIAKRKRIADVRRG